GTGRPSQAQPSSRPPNWRSPAGRRAARSAAQVHRRRAAPRWAALLATEPMDTPQPGLVALDFGWPKQIQLPADKFMTACRALHPSGKRDRSLGFERSLPRHGVVRISNPDHQRMTPLAASRAHARRPAAGPIGGWWPDVYGKGAAVAPAPRGDGA